MEHPPSCNAIARVDLDLDQALPSDLPAHAQSSQVGDDPNAVNANISQGSLQVDVTAVSSRSSIRNLHDVISRLDEKKRELVRSIGFHGLLHFPALRQINRRLSVWLMSKVDQLSHQLVIDDHMRIKFTKDDVALVFGIPSSGRRMLENGMPSKDTITRIMREYLGIQSKGNRSIKASQEVIDRHHDGDMTRSEEDSFKVAFVVYVMSTLLAPGAKYDYAGVDYWNALDDPSAISTFDWAEYVLQRLLDAVVKLKSDIKSTTKIPNITGCSLFLQVLYLDSIDLGSWTMEHDLFPHIRCFPSDRMRFMILADAVGGSTNCLENEFGKSKLRTAFGVCYHWASHYRGHGAGHDSCGHLALWEATISFVQALRVPLEVYFCLQIFGDGPLYLALADFETQSVHLSGAGCLKFINALFSITEAYLKGFSYQFGGDCNVTDLGVNVMSLGSGLLNSDAIDLQQSSRMSDKYLQKRQFGCRSSGLSCFHELVRSGKNACFNVLLLGLFHSASSLHNTLAVSSSSNSSSSLNSVSKCIDSCTDVWDPNCMVRKAMSKYYMCVHRAKVLGAIDLNAYAPDVDDESDIRPRKVIPTVAEPKTPWQLGFEWSFDPKLSLVLKQLIANDDGLHNKMPCFVHYIPKYIEVMPSAVKKQFLGQSEMEMDLFDAILRRFKQCDDRIYGAEGSPRWRHFVESDFMGSIFAGWFDILDPSVRGQFIGHCVCYDVPNCKLLFFPVLLEHRWVCYVWRMQDNTIVVFDPSRSYVLSVDGVDRSHGHAVSVLKRALEAVASEYFVGWEHDSDATSTKVLHLPESGIPCLNRTGVLCAYFCRCFDGDKLIPELHLDEVEGISAMLLGEVMELTGNFGKIPGI